MDDGPPAVLAFFHHIVAGREAEFEEWSQHEHLPERIALPGFVMGRRYEAVSRPELLPLLRHSISRSSQVGGLHHGGQRTDIGDAYGDGRNYKERVSHHL
jgi:hypothetical protein